MGIQLPIANGGGVTPLAGGIATVARLPSAAGTTNSTLVKNAEGRVYFIVGYNAAATPRYLKLYSKATAPTIGTDVPLLSLPLPPQAGFAFDYEDIGVYFPLGIGYGMTTGTADNDTGALTAADVLGLNIGYA